MPSKVYFMNTRKWMKTKKLNVKSSHSKVIAQSDLRAKCFAEACHTKKYADVVLACARSSFCGELAEFTIIVNLMERMILGAPYTIGHGLDSYDWIEHKDNIHAMTSWVIKTYIGSSAEFEVNLPYAMTKRVQQPTTFMKRFMRLREARDECDKLLRGNYKDASWRSKLPFIEQVWTMNEKLSEACSDDVYQDIEKAFSRLGIAA